MHSYELRRERVRGKEDKQKGGKPMPPHLSPLPQGERILPRRASVCLEPTYGNKKWMQNPAVYVNFKTIKTN